MDVCCWQKGTSNARWGKRKGVKKVFNEKRGEGCIVVNERTARLQRQEEGYVEGSWRKLLARE
jgi:hypothetical protein